MSSLEIAELTGKKLGHIHRDIKTQLIDGLHGFNTKDDPRLDNFEIQGVTVIFDNRGYWSEVLLDRPHTLTLMTGYDVKARRAINKRWLELEEATKPPMTLEQMTLAVIQEQGKALLQSASAGSRDTADGLLHKAAGQGY